MCYTELMITVIISKHHPLFAPSLPQHQSKVITHPHLGTKKTSVSKTEKIGLAAELSGTQER